MTVLSFRLFVKLWSINKVPRRYKISNSKYDSERARRDLQFARYRICFGLFYQEQWLFKVLDFLLNFEAFKKHQDGIRFQIQNTILKELDEIYNLNQEQWLFEVWDFL